MKDIPVRQMLGGFVPSNGVGTGFVRPALDRLAASRGGEVFDPACLTEDYETGFRLHAQGASQVFIPVHWDSAGPIATREYFPRRLRAAVRQRSRWVTGIALQGWQLHGWRVPLRQVYWLWRDRKGLIGNLLSPVANVILIYAAASWASGHGLHLSSHIPPWLFRVCSLTLAVSAVQLWLRAGCCARIYGWRLAALAPVRLLWGNVINGLATAVALRQFASARLRRGGLAWRKTDHAYPGHRAVRYGRPLLGELLVRMELISPDALDRALRSVPQGVRLGEHLVGARVVAQQDVYRALAAQSGIAIGLPPPGEWNRMAARALPLEALRRWKVLPYRISVGQIHVLTPEVPSEEMAADLARLSSLEIRFRLVLPADFEKAAAEFPAFPEPLL